MNKFMKEAIDEVRKGIKFSHGGPFGAVVVRNGKIVSRSHNMVLKTNDPTAHAEICAIRDASLKLKRYNLSDCELYTTCEPCPMCLGAIFWARIKKVYYGCTKDDAEKIGFDDKKFYNLLKKYKNKNFKKIDRKKCMELFYSWQKNKNKIFY